MTTTGFPRTDPTDHGSDDRTGAHSRARALTAQMFRGMLATQELLAMYLGVRLGLYETLARGGPATVDEVAERAGVAPRYAREWLEQQAVAGVLLVDDPAREPDARTYCLPPGHDEVLTTSDSPLSMVALAVLPAGAVARALPSLLAAYRDGTGVADEVYGPDWRDGHGGANRALFVHQLPSWIAQAVPAVHALLSAGPARIADVACGAGWAGIALACAYPSVTVDGFDLDRESIAAAARHAAAAGVANRVRFEVRDAADPASVGGYDLVCLFDALHELARPVEVLRACRTLRTGGGQVLVMDARVAEAFTAPADNIERFQYATSVLHCLAAGLSTTPSAGTGTVMRAGTVRRYALAAGFADARVLHVDDRFHRLYRLDG
jgi:SAM-dependent methyltransferase